MMKKPLLCKLIVSLYLVCGGVSAQTDDQNCMDGTELQHNYPSGAPWSLCVTANSVHGLDVSMARYRAPGDTSRSVLRHAHLGQVLIHYHDEPDARVLVNVPQGEGRYLLPMNSTNCDGDSRINLDGAKTVCSRVVSTPTIARFAQRQSLHGEQWELSAALARSSLNWTTSMTFTEDGQIRPSLSLSGRATRFGSDARFAAVAPDEPGITRANILTTWRLVFDLDTPGEDVVEQFDFPMQTSQGNRRPMQVKPVLFESFAKVERDSFRGWRITDSSGSGYYLDPANSGFSYRSNKHNWAQFDVAVTRYKTCEQYASDNPEIPAGCGQSLDDFMSGEPLADDHTVIWFSQSRTLNPSAEDWPVIGNFYQSFNLMPFDWTASSPFELITQ